MSQHAGMESNNGLIDVFSFVFDFGVSFCNYDRGISSSSGCDLALHLFIK